MTGIDNLLSAVLYRRSCPDPEILGDYYQRRLAPGDRLAVALHLRLCSRCTADLAMYATSQDDEAGGASDGLFGADRNALGGLVSRVAWAIPRGRPTRQQTRGDALQTSQSYQLGLVNGAARISAEDKSLASVLPIQQIYQSEDIQVTLSIWSAINGYRKGAVLGTVSPPSTALGVELWNTVGLLRSSAVNCDGRVFFAQLEAGNYFLCSRQDSAEIWIETRVEDRPL
jgi:hypothetical protein